MEICPIKNTLIRQIHRRVIPATQIPERDMKERPEATDAGSVAQSAQNPGDEIPPKRSKEDR